MRIPRRRIAQACGAVGAAATFLPWQTTVGESGTESVQGIDVNGGQLVLVVCLVTIGLVQVGWRPAWIGVGFGAAIAIRELLNNEADSAWGLPIAAAACLVAVVLLVWDMFANISAPGDDADADADADGGGPGGRGLSGPLGRRRR